MGGSPRPSPDPTRSLPRVHPHPAGARIYVGPKGLPLPVGVYAVWVDIASATSGDPVRPYDILTIA